MNQLPLIICYWRSPRQRVDRVKTSIPIQRGGQPEEVANAVMWLLSEEASYITGSILDVSGGR